MKYVVVALMTGALCFGLMGCGADKAAVDKNVKDVAALQQTITALQGEVDGIKAGVKAMQDEMAAAKAKEAEAAAAKTAKPAKKGKK
jgi:cell division protein FtsB